MGEWRKRREGLATQPSVARGMGIVALVLAAWTGLQGWTRSHPAMDPPAVEIACSEFVEVKRGSENRLACSDAAELAACGRIVALDSVTIDAQGKCHVSPQGMAGPWRLLLGMPLDLNRATVADFAALDGVGLRTAKALVTYRERQGNFTSVDAIDNVAGVGPKTLERLRPYLMVSSAND